MKVIIAGGRDFEPTDKDWELLDSIHLRLGVDPELAITEVVNGGARGADAFGETWAHAQEITITDFPANWTKYGRAAGPIRNTQMAEYADGLIAFPGGKGTAHMIKEAGKKGLWVYDVAKEEN